MHRDLFCSLSGKLIDLNHFLLSSYLRHQYLHCLRLLRSKVDGPTYSGAHFISGPPDNFGFQLYSNSDTHLLAGQTTVREEMMEKEEDGGFKLLKPSFTVSNVILFSYRFLLYEEITIPVLCIAQQ